MGEQLVWACKNGDLDQVKDIMEKPGFDVNAEILNGRSGIHFAADYGQSNVIEYLLSKGADINRADKYGITPLLASIYESNTDCVKLLLEKVRELCKGKSFLLAPDGSSYIECAETDEVKSLLM
ncbi:myotrophin [Pocillopora verrucosa]|uniref:myotrophin n=1 Tax=Pocillopora verrucosa TaxID=203993 RepID=UPI00333F5AB7